MSKTAIVLTSGGLDSTTCLAIAASQGFELVALTFAYGQRHTQEIDAARLVAGHFGVRQHLIFNLDVFGALGGSALTADIEVPKHRSLEEVGAGVPVTYVPARNLVFLSYAVAVAEVTGAQDLFIGVNAVDFSGYPDCRPEFVVSFEQTANRATRLGTEGRPIKIHAPLQHLSKAQIIKVGTDLGAPYGLTMTCYSPEGTRSCGACDACLLRLQGFAEAGVIDPIAYATP